MSNEKLVRYNAIAVARTEDGRVSVPQMVGRHGSAGMSLSEIVEMFESKPFVRDVGDESVTLRWKVKSIEVVEDNKNNDIELSISESFDEKAEKLQIFANEAYRYLGEFISGAESKQLSMELLILNLKDLLELAGKHFDKGAVNKELEESLIKSGYKGKWEELPKEVCELLDQLIGDIDSGVIEPSEIKRRLENIQFFSEAYYEHLEGRKYDEIIK